MTSSYSVPSDTSRWWLWSLLAAVCGVLAVPTESQVVSCKMLLRDADLYIQKGQLSTDAAFFVDAPYVLCPTVSAGDDVPGQCEPWPKPRDLGPEPPYPEWDGRDFGWTLLQLILSEENYSTCYDIFDQELFASLVSSIPSVGDKALERFRYWARFPTSYVCELSPEPEGRVIGRRSLPDGGEIILAEVDSANVETEIPTIRFDDLQRGILTVFDSIAGWSYCARDRRWGRTGEIVLGYFGTNRQIAIYHQACFRDDLYGIDTRDLSPMHRSILIGAHEFGHAMGSLLGDDTTLPSLEIEEMASYLGSFFAECSARLLASYVESCRRLFEQTPGAAKYDDLFLRCQSRRWKSMTERVRALRSELEGQMEKPLNSEVLPESWYGPCLSTELR